MGYENAEERERELKTQKTLDDNAKWLHFQWAKDRRDTSESEYERADGNRHHHVKYAFSFCSITNQTHTHTPHKHAQSKANESTKHFILRKMIIGANRN